MACKESEGKGEMKPTTLFLYIYLSFCAVAVIMSWMATGISEKRLLSKIKTIHIQKEQIANLTFRNDYLRKLVRVNNSNGKQGK